MQVSLLSLNDVTVLDKRISGALFSLQDGSFGSLLQHPASALDQPAQQKDDRDGEAAAGHTAPCSTEVIKEAERNVERSSRTFQRQVAHDRGVEQFRQERQGLRQASQEKATAPSPRGSSSTGTESSPETASKLADKATTANKTQDSGTHSGKSPTARPTTSSIDYRPADALSTRAALTGQSTPRSSGNAVASTARVSNGLTARALPNAVGVTRVTAAAQVQAAARPIVVGSPKGSAQTPLGALSARSSTKSGAFSTVKAGVSRAADTADRGANIERIVRVIAQRIGAERSHTVMRLDPPELGSLRLEMDLKGDVLVLRIDTSTHVAHRLLSEDVDKLRQGLEVSGIHLERVDVRPPTHGPESGEQGNSENAEGQGRSQEGFGESDAEHSEEQRRNSRSAWSDEHVTRGTGLESARESPVDVVA
jgi:flagellar hook-length control protein FliK